MVGRRDCSPLDFLTRFFGAESNFEDGFGARDTRLAVGAAYDPVADERLCTARFETQGPGAPSDVALFDLGEHFGGDFVSQLSVFASELFRNRNGSEARFAGQCRIGHLL